MSRTNVLNSLILVASFVVTSVVLKVYFSTLTSDFQAVALYMLSAVQLIAAGSVYFFLQQKSELVSSTFEPLCSKVVRISVVVLIFILMATPVVALTNHNNNFEGLHWIGVVWFSFYCFMQIAFVEEVFFRGVLFSALGEKSFTALILSSLLFAVYHIDNGLHVLPYYMAMGMVYGVLRRASISIPTLAVGHGASIFFLKATGSEEHFLMEPAIFYIVAPCALLLIATLGNWLTVPSLAHNES